MKNQLLSPQIPAALDSWLQTMQAEIEPIMFVADEASAQLSQVCDATDYYSAALPYVPEELADLVDEDCFTVELNRLIHRHWKGTKRELCHRALLLENTFYKIQSGKRAPSRDTLICLVLTLEINREEANHLLGFFGYALGEAYKRDYIILRSLDQGRSPQEVNLLLEAYRMKLLGVEL